MSGVGVAPLIPIEPPSPSAFTIKITWDPSVANAPAGFTSDILAVVKYLETEFDNPVTINIDVGYNKVAGQTMQSGDIGESEALLQSVGYSTLRDTVITDARTSTDASVVGSLPVSSPVNGATYWVSTAQAKALDLAVANPTDLDGYVGFSSNYNFTFGDTAAGGPVKPGTYDFFATALHEITEDMGRKLLTGQTFGDDPDSLTLLDLLHYSGSGVRDFSATTAGYFSVNGGATNLGEFNPQTNGDSGDWAVSQPNDPFDAFGTTGAAEPATSDDLAVMDAIGWNPAGAGFPLTPVTQIGSPFGSTPGTPDLNPVTTPGLTPLVPVNDPIGGELPISAPVSVGLAFTAASQASAFAQGHAGWLAGSPLAAVAATGGAAGDKFSYGLSGPYAASFSLTPTGNGALLAVGQSALTGSGTGALRTMTLTATDETAATHPTAASALNVVVGDGGNDTITVATLSGIVASAPTFIGGLGGNDIVNATDLSGPVFFDCGTEFNMMAGGSGQDVYEFAAGAGSPSVGTVQDIITNFKAPVDLIDLAWVGSRFMGVAALAGAATTIAADSVGWQASGGNTYVYANDSNQPVPLGATDVKIELEGNIVLTRANFSHS
jgi:hypothetical protein